MFFVSDLKNDRALNRLGAATTPYKQYLEQRKVHVNGNFHKMLNPQSARERQGRLKAYR